MTPNTVGDTMTKVRGLMNRIDGGEFATPMFFFMYRGKMTPAEDVCLLTEDKISVVRTTANKSSFSTLMQYHKDKDPVRVEFKNSFVVDDYLYGMDLSKLYTTQADMKEVIRVLSKMTARENKKLRSMDENNNKTESS